MKNARRGSDDRYIQGPYEGSTWDHPTPVRAKKHLNPFTEERHSVEQICAACGLIHGAGWWGKESWIQLDPCPEERFIEHGGMLFCTEDCLKYWSESGLQLIPTKGRTKVSDNIYKVVIHSDIFFEDRYGRHIACFTTQDLYSEGAYNHLYESTNLSAAECILTLSSALNTIQGWQTL